MTVDYFPERDFNKGGQTSLRKQINWCHTHTHTPPKAQFLIPFSIYTHSYGALIQSSLMALSIINVAIFQINISNPLSQIPLM